MLSFWLLVCRPYIESAYNVVLSELRTNKPGMGDADLRREALHSLYLFPKMDKDGMLHFRKRMEKSAAEDLLNDLLKEAGFADVNFTWHGVVRLHEAYLTMKTALNCFLFRRADTPSLTLRCKQACRRCRFSLGGGGLPPGTCLAT